MPEIVSSMVQVHVVRRRESEEPEYLLLHRAADEELYPNVWQVITGGIEPGEWAEEAARRELLEETGLVAQVLWASPFVASFFDASRDAVQMVPVFTALFGPEATPKLSSEHQDYEWLPFEQALDRLVFPSHIEGTRIAHDFLITGHRGHLFTQL